MDKADSRRNVVVDPKTIELIERVVYDEARGEGPEGRNAVRAVIYNRLAANRRDFGGNTVLGVLNAPKQFQGVMEKGKGDVRRLTIPEDIRENYMQEHVAFVRGGEDPTNGATFFQNPGAARNPYSADGGTQIGKHVFYDNYRGNKVDVPEFAVALRGYGKSKPTPEVTGEVTPKATAQAPQRKIVDASKEGAQIGLERAASAAIPDFLRALNPPQESLAQGSTPVRAPNPRATAVPERPLAAPQGAQRQSGIQRIERASELNPIRMNKGGMAVKEEDDGGMLFPKLSRSSEPAPTADREEALKGASRVVDLATDFIPVVGEAKSAVDAYNSAKEGDYVGAGLGALGAIPGIGMMARGVNAGRKASKAGEDAFKPLSKADAPVATKEKSTSSSPLDKPLVADEMSESYKALNSALSKYTPEKTVKAYKLFRTNPDKPGELFPLFVNAEKGVPVGAWVDAEVGPLSAGGKVKSKIGELAYRPGWHAGDNVAATHIGGKSQPGVTAPDYRPAHQVWAEVELPDDVDWQSVADSRASLVKSGPNKGKLNVKEAHITDQLPEGGFYRYKTNSNMQGSWLIGGSMRVNKPLDLQEAKAIQKQTGIDDLPSLPEVIEQKKLKLKDLNQEAVKELKAFYPDKYQELADPSTFKSLTTPKMAKGGLIENEDDMKLNKFACGGMMAPDTIVGYEEESGNEIPFGSTASEVADDIPVMMSEGEVVLPGDVVRWHGLKHIMEMRQEAKMGLMAMAMEGQIQTYDEDTEGAEEEDTSYETPEGNEVDIAQHEVIEEEMEYGDDEDLDYSTDIEDLVGDEELIVVIRKDPAAFKSNKY